MTIVTALVVIAIIILAHEVGHFVMARREDIEVQEFALGFGPRLFGVRRGETLYSVRILPLGGFVRMTGEGGEDRDNPRGFAAKSPGAKVRVSAAGPLMNIALAAVIFVTTFTLVGIPTPVEDTVVGEAVVGKPAYEAGIREGDRIVAVAGQPVRDWEDFVKKVRASQAGQPLPLTIEREGRVLQVTVVPEAAGTDQPPLVGVRQALTFRKVGVWEGLRQGFLQTFQITWVLLLGLGHLFSGAASPSDVAGPVGITRMIGDAAAGGWVYLLNFAALLSINLGILNLLPIPALDGSRIVFALVEAVRGRPMEPEREGFIHFLGFVFLMALIALITYNDILRIIDP
ncbi:MAG: RIP metalloprotease RseP [Syntrophomonadaceae bacterium]|nr:RIP metalloprotease RseP [Syntrophomonadaceae bacterium]